MRHAGGKQAQAHQAVLLFNAAEGRGEFVFAFAQGLYRFIAGAHDLADLVAQDFGVGDQFALRDRRLGWRSPRPACAAADGRRTRA